MTLYCAIDLHSNNNVPVVIDDNDQILFQKRLPNDLETAINALKPFQGQLIAIAVESTFNWYWLVDGLIEQGYELKLVNTSAVSQYNGIKHTNDQTDAFLSCSSHAARHFTYRLYLPQRTARNTRFVSQTVTDGSTSGHPYAKRIKSALAINRRKYFKQADKKG